MPPTSIGTELVWAEGTVLRSRYRHASGCESRRFRYVFEVADRATRPDGGMYGAVCRKMMEFDKRSNSDSDGSLNWAMVIFQLSRDEYC